MDFTGVFFFGFLTAIIIVPQVLRHQERGRLHETLRLAFERGQPVPPELIMALQSGRRRDRYDPYGYAGAPPWPMPAGAAAPAHATPDLDPGASAPLGAFARSAAAAPPLQPAATLPPGFLNSARRDLRRGLIWLGVGLGFVGAGLACYAGLYEVGGAQETLSLFSAFGSIPAFVGLTYLALWAVERRRARV